MRKELKRKLYTYFLVWKTLCTTDMMRRKRCECCIYILSGRRSVRLTYIVYKLRWNKWKRSKLK
jgi:hypothetical protein